MLHPIHFDPLTDPLACMQWPGSATAAPAPSPVSRNVALLRAGQEDPAADIVPAALLTEFKSRDVLRGQRA
jgi:hypothetical protein